MYLFGYLRNFTFKVFESRRLVKNTSRKPKNKKAPAYTGAFAVGRSESNATYFTCLQGRELVLPTHTSVMLK